ncbi:MAG: hypothetical protein LKI28_05085 [Ancrocorticia sp.]|nr:hypothetical protein [Ancrocorticia sp.]
MMASIIVRGLDAAVKQRLVLQAKEHGHSMEAEARDILTRATGQPHIGLALLRVAKRVNGADGLQVPERSDTARVAEFE